MSDNLRDRIAAVVLAHNDESDACPDCTCGWEWHGYGLWKDCFSGHVADAVIAALGLKKVIDVNRSVPQSRYVTDWENDD